MSSRGGTAVPASLASREERHRRTVLLGLAGLLVLSMSPIFGHHAATGADALFSGRDHVGPICLIAWHHILGPVHTGFHVLFVLGLLYALGDRTRAWASAHRVLATLPAQPPEPGDPFWIAAKVARVDPGAIRVVDGLPSPAFTAGWLRPRVYVARALAERLTSDQLAAVLSHEGAHARRRDPLRLSLLRLLAYTVFWIPALRRLAEDIADEAEIRADDVAARDRPLVLASAMLELAKWCPQRVVLQEGVGFHDRDLLERRVRRLAGEDTPIYSHVTRRSVGAALAALLLVWASGVIVAHPLPDAVRDHHAALCARHPSPGIAHLFCVAALSPDVRRP
jgi:Zn-dependent protease with chaperone function